MRVTLLIGLLLLGLAACDSDDEAADGSVDPTAGSGGGDGDGDDDGGPSECNVTAPTACPADMPTYADVAPIFEDRCVMCHAGPGESELCPGCWALTDYGHVARWATEIRTAMLTCLMPPEGSGVTMSDAERMKILEWIRCGAPE